MSRPEHSALPPEQRALVQVLVSEVRQEVTACLEAELRPLRGEIRVLRDRLRDKLYSKQELAHIFSVNVRTVERRIEEGLLHPVPSMKEVRFTAAEVDRAREEGVF